MSDLTKHDPWFLRLPTLAEEEEAAEHSPSKENRTCNFGELPFDPKDCPTQGRAPNPSTPHCTHSSPRPAQ